jgi:two-component system phosphate regulon sensor histidine kinase PhoR
VSGFADVMDGVIFADGEGCLTLLNPAAAQLSGLGAVAVQGRPLQQLRGRSELVDAVIDDQQVVLSRGASCRVVEIHHSERDLLYIKLASQVVRDCHGQPAGVMSVLEDVTANYKTDQLRNQYLSIVAHELRTPLTGIKTFSTMLAKGRLGALEPRQREVVESIREQSVRLEHQIDKLVNLGFLESQEYGRDLQTFDVVEMVRTAVTPLLQPAREKSLALSVEVPDRPVEVQADRSDLRRALQGLLENAIKFTPPGGTVRVFATLDGLEVALGVADTGIGIEPRYQRRIFEKFFQVEDPLTRHHGGAGLGLFVAQGIVAAHGSRIEVASELGRGAKFTFRLRVQGPESRSGTDSSSSSSLRGVLETAATDVPAAAAPMSASHLPKGSSTTVSQ